MILVDADVSDDWDSRTDWSALADRAARAALAASRFAAILPAEAEVSIKFTSDAEVQSLNAEWRGKDKSTNVLSFPMAEPEDLAAAPMLGDIVLARGVCEAEAADKRIEVESHAAHLVVHGMLHLQGYDHENSKDARVMEMLEAEIVLKLGYAHPYGKQ